MSADGQSMWASVQKEPPPHEPDYGSIEELFCLPVTEPKDKGAAAPVKKEPKEVNTSETLFQTKRLCAFVSIDDNTLIFVSSMCSIDNIH